MNAVEGRRRAIAVSGTGVMLAAVPARAQVTPGREERIVDAQTTATEELMLEHGVLRRCLAVFGESAARLSGRGNGGPVPADALRDAVALFIGFGGQLHERRIEEEIVFPQVSRIDETLDATAKVLKFQHDRGQQILGWVQDRTREGRIGRGDDRPVADALAGFVRMYTYHAALEDTVVFPRWKLSLKGDQHRELVRRFEEIQAKEIGRDGLANALERLVAIESAFHLGQLAQWTAPPPPGR